MVRMESEQTGLSSLLPEAWTIENIDINRLNIRYGRFEIFLLSLPLRELDSRLSITESMSRENRVEAMILDEGKLHHVLFCLRI